ncbi:hypothetical protein ACGFRG_05415 [Streptomyces sp. NPDC048696]|uniref:hypothetical protein n=1 Tax=Streptomyces sp. NPDC048696 TaxID=3365585 RepID=UPI003715A406
MSAGVVSQRVAPIRLLLAGRLREHGVRHGPAFLEEGDDELVFTEHDSYFRGIYHRADSPDGKIEIQPNSIPGDDDEDDLYAAEHPTVQILVLTLTPAPVPNPRGQLDAIEGLEHLKRESL